MTFKTALFSLLVATAATAQPNVFAPYVDMSKPASNLPQIQAASGLHHFTLAFVIAGQGCVPAWAGTAPVQSDTKITEYVDKLRQANGDVIVAFGGYDGTDLAQACPDVPELQSAYQAVINRYKVNVLDFDVEHLAIEDQPSIDRRSQALKALAAANTGLQINFTLPATPTGLTPQSLSVLKSAIQFGVPISIVNLMAMDYGSPVLTGAMGPNAVAAASGALCQMKSLGLNARVGITPMIGVNDTLGEVFNLADAQTVLSYTLANSNSVGLLSFWSVGRDNGSCKETVSPTCSGIVQDDWAFAKIFQQFEKGSGK